MKGTGKLFKRIAGEEALEVKHTNYMKTLRRKENSSPSEKITKCIYLPRGGATFLPLVNGQTLPRNRFL
jgi:hypothetical protein